MNAEVSRQVAKRVERKITQVCATCKRYQKKSCYERQGAGKDAQRGDWCSGYQAVKP